MNKLLALSIAFANVLLFGQTPATTPRIERVDQMSKRFPPDLIAPAKSKGKATLSRPYCVSPSPGAKSLSFKPCRTDSRKLHIVPPFKTVPPAKPATVPHKIR
jgi:hypothetical protein